MDKNDEEKKEQNEPDRKDDINDKGEWVMVSVTKFCNYGSSLKSLGKFLEVYLAFWQNFDPILAILWLSDQF